MKKEIFVIRHKEEPSHRLAICTYTGDTWTRVRTDHGKALRFSGEKCRDGWEMVGNLGLARHPLADPPPPGQLVAVVLPDGIMTAITPEHEGWPSVTAWIEVPAPWGQWLIDNEETSSTPAIGEVY